MALIKCSECGKEISDKATACPGCGAPVQFGASSFEALPEMLRPAPAVTSRKVGALLFLGILFFPIVFSWFTLREGYSKRARIWAIGWALLSAFIIFPSRCAEVFGTSSSSSVSTSTPSVTPASPAPESNPAPAENWFYNSEDDKMRGVTSYWAKSVSLESKNFGFPYQDVRQLIQLRQQPQDGFQIMLTLSEGQYTCGFDGCSVSVRFDDGPVSKFSVNQATGTMEGILFIQNKSRFLSGLRGASRVMIESDFFNQGPQTFEFNVAGLRWDH